MNRLSRRQFLRASGTVVGATVLPLPVLPHRVGAAEKKLIPKKMPFPPNDEFGSYEPTITPDGNTIYFARFAGSGDKRVLGTTTDIFVTRRIRQSGEWPGTDADWTAPERLPDTVNSDSVD
jgi:WD40-like Beta Propeller Repeat